MEMRGWLYNPDRSLARKELRDMAAVRKACSGRVAKTVSVYHGIGFCNVVIRFVDGFEITAGAGSFHELVRYLRNWRNLHDGVLFVNGECRERVSANNAYLVKVVMGQRDPRPAQRYYPENRMRMPGGPARRNG